MVKVKKIFIKDSFKIILQIVLKLTTRKDQFCAQKQAYFKYWKNDVFGNLFHCLITLK